jgi:hypothetical protein
MADMSPNPQSEQPLEPPNRQFGGLTTPSYSSLNSSSKDLSLSVNYLPAKFSRPHSPGVHQRRKGEKDPDDFIPKQGGGREAFRSNEARMPGAGDDDYDGVTGSWRGKHGPKGRLRWNKFKWVLFCANLLVSKNDRRPSPRPEHVMHSYRYTPSLPLFFVS